MRRLVGAAALIATLSGCAAGSHRAGAVRTLFRRYETAVAQGNPGLACRLMSATVVRSLTARTAGTPSESCAVAFGQDLLAEDPTSRARQGELAATLRVRILSLHGDQARVQLANRLGPITEVGIASAVRTGNRWLVSAFPTQETDGRYLVYRVPSLAMTPTLAAGQIALVDPGAFAHRSPAIGDVVVFHPPANTEIGCADTGEGITISGGSSGRACAAPGAKSVPTLFVKRIVAGPGDTVSIRAGTVIRNGRTEPEPFPVTCGTGIGCTFARPVRIPAGTWFMVGDNRAQSADSREWGPIPTGWIVGPIARVLPLGQTR